MRHPAEYQNIRRRDKTSGIHVFIPADIICKALTQAGIDCTEMRLKCKSYPGKDGKRAKIIIEVKKA